MNTRFIICVLLVSVLPGCGDKTDSVSKKAGETVGKTVTDFAKGVGKGVDQQLAVDVTLSPDVQALGLTKTIAKSNALDIKKGIAVYMIASKPVSDTLIARALNSDGMEIGRSKKLVSMQKDDASYVTFEFEDAMDSATVKKYSIEK